jgi:hypothetical protein
MSKRLKFLIGVAAALVAGWISHGPLGRGEDFLEQLDSALEAAVPEFNVTGLGAVMQRDPLARTALLSGPADCFQRRGLGSLPGIDARVRAIHGIARVEWTNPPPEGECR